ncbi:MAG: GNAT family N-acetyltransferase [Bacteroidales bacterium]|nr:GNAT family N-acetyltransferase [Bacteroidales bacterium]
MIIHRQKWHEFTRLLIADRKGSVQVEMYDQQQEWGGTAWIYGLWVDPAYRRQGKAAELLTVAEKMAAQHGHKSVMLEWKKQDTPVEVLRWYKRRGYLERTLHTEGDYYLLEKRLQNE